MDKIRPVLGFICPYIMQYDVASNITRSRTLRNINELRTLRNINELGTSSHINNSSLKLPTSDLSPIPDTTNRKKKGL